MSLTTTGERIKLHREMGELSQEELGARIGVKRAAIQKYEKGTVENIPIKTIEKLAAIFGVTPTYLLGWEQEDVHLSHEAKVVKGIKYFYGNDAVELLETYQQLSAPGRKRLNQYANEVAKLYSN